MRLAAMKQRRRSGTTLVESAFVYPLLFFIFLSMIIGGIGVFRYQEMAALAREASRYASTHGAQYRKDAGLGTGTAGVAESTSPLPSTAPYNTAPWNTILWYQTHPTAAADPNETRWADIIYDNTIRMKMALLDPATLKVSVGWTPVINQPNNPDNFPGSRVTVVVKYQVFPEAFIWWEPSTTLLSVSTAPMPITN